jgi:hypothetical protein
MEKPKFPATEWRPPLPPLANNLTTQDATIENMDALLRGETTHQRQALELIRSLSEAIRVNIQELTLLTSLKQDSLISLIKKLPNLSQLSMNARGLKELPFEKLENPSQIHFLKMASLVNLKNFDPIIHLTGLRHLVIKRFAPKEDAFSFLSSLPNIDSLTLETSCVLEPKEMEAISTSGLRRVSLEFRMVAPIGERKEMLSYFSGIEELELRCRAVNLTGIEELSELERLALAPYSTFRYEGERYRVDNDSFRTCLPDLEVQVYAPNDEEKELGLPELPLLRI